MNKISRDKKIAAVRKEESYRSLKGGKVDASLSKEIRMGNKVLPLRKVII